MKNMEIPQGFRSSCCTDFPTISVLGTGSSPRSSKLGIGSLCLTFEDMDRLAFVIPSLLAWPNRPPSLKTLLTLQTLWDSINSHWRVLIGEIVLPVSRRSCILTESEVRLRSAVIRSRTPSRGGSQLPLLPRRDAGISGTSIPSRGGSVWKKTDEISFVIFGRPGHPGGRIQMRLSTAQPPPSIIPTSLRLSCIPIVTVT